MTDVLYPDGGAAQYATVQKLLDRMEAKGYVRRDRTLYVHVFAAVLDRDELIGRRLRSLAETLCDGSLTPLLTHLARASDLTEEDRLALRAIIEESDRRRAGRDGAGRGRRGGSSAGRRATGQDPAARSSPALTTVRPDTSPGGRRLMESLVHAMLSNALAATGPGPGARPSLARAGRSPALIHGLWLLVLLKLVTPPIVPVAPRPDRTAGRRCRRPLPGPRGGVGAPRGAGRMAASSRARRSSDELCRAEVGAGRDRTGQMRRRPTDAPTGPMAEPAESADPSPCPRSRRGAVAGSSRSWCWSSPAPWSGGRWRRCGSSASSGCWASFGPRPPTCRRRSTSWPGELGLRRPPTVWLVPGRVPPMLWAFGGRARLLVPAELWPSLDERSSGRRSWPHELAHLKRKDHWVRWLDLAVAGLYWWHPVVWWARRGAARGRGTMLRRLGRVGDAPRGQDLRAPP